MDLTITRVGNGVYRLDFSNGDVLPRVLATGEAPKRLFTLLERAQLHAPAAETFTVTFVNEPRLADSYADFQALSKFMGAE